MNIPASVAKRARGPMARCTKRTDWPAVTVTLPWPPSANRYWRKWRGRMVVSPEARAYKNAVKGNAQLAPLGPTDAEVSVYIQLFRPSRRGDVDNFSKVILDSLQGVLFDNDSQITLLQVARFDDKANPRVEVSITKRGEG